MSVHYNKKKWGHGIRNQIFLDLLTYKRSLWYKNTINTAKSACFLLPGFNYVIEMNTTAQDCMHRHRSMSFWSAHWHVKKMWKKHNRITGLKVKLSSKDNIHLLCFCVSTLSQWLNSQLQTIPRCSMEVCTALSVMLYTIISKLWQILIHYNTL